MSRETLDQRELAQRVGVAAAVAAGRAVLELAADPGAEPSRGLVEVAASVQVLTVGELDPQAAAGKVIVDVDGVLAQEPVVAASALARCVEAGAAVVAAMHGGLEPLVLPRFPGAVILRQRAVEVSVLTVDDAAPSPMPELVFDGAGPRWTMVVAGADVPDDVASTVPAAGAVQSARIDALERANAELRRANARLRAGAGSVESGREAELNLQIELLRRELDEAIEAARQNDELFQDARRWLEVRDEEIRGLRATLDAKPHRVAAGVAHRARQLSSRGRREPG